MKKIWSSLFPPRHSFPQRPKLVTDVCVKCGMTNRAEALIHTRCYEENKK